MASVSGHNATVNGNGNSPGSPDKQLQSMYQGLEMCLKDSDKTYEDKVEAVLAAWKRLPSFKSTSQSEDLHSITKCLYRDTLHLVLRCEWSNLPAVCKTNLSVTVKATRDEMEDDFEARQFCEKVQKLVKNPWEDKTLKKILHANPDLTESEAMEFCLMETPTLLSMRVNLLCDDNCEDLALKLVAWCRKCLASPTDTRFLESCPPSQCQHWMDLHVALLYHYQAGELVKQLQQMPLEEGYQLVQRFMDRDTTTAEDGSTLDISAVDTKESGVWRNSLKIAEKASQIFVVTAMHRCPPPVCLMALTTQLVHLERRIGTATPDLANMIRTLMAGDHVASAHMYIVAGALSQEPQVERCFELRPLCIELYVRALTIDLNDLEERRHRSVGQVTDVVRQAEMNLSSKFSALAELVKTQLGIHRECVLTAFSLNPTQQLFKQLDHLAAASSAQSEDRKPTRDQLSGTASSADYSAVCLAHYNPSVIEHNRAAVVGEPPPGSGGGPGGGFVHPFTTSLNGMDTEKNGSVKTEALTSEDADSGVDLSDGAASGEQEPASSSPTSSFSASLPYCLGAAAALGISKQVMDDLSTVLHSGRWEVLSWNLNGGWDELRSLCLRYLCNPADMRSVTRELKYLPTNIDYRQFEHIPRPERDENYGIEKGYEIRTSDDEDEVNNQRSAKMRKRRKSNGKRSSYPASGESSDAEPVPTAGGPTAADSSEAEPKKRVLKKKVYKRIRALKTSSDSDSQPSPANAKAKNGPKTPKKSTKTSAKSARVIRTSSSRIDASHLDKIHANEFLTTPPSAAESSHLVKTLRMLRPEFGSGNSWNDPNVTPPAPRPAQPPSTPVNVHSNNWSTAPAAGSSTTPSDHFAPMLSTLNMNPKIVLTRTPLNNAMLSPAKKTSPGTLPATCVTGSLANQRRVGAKIVTYNIGGSSNISRNPYVVLQRLDKSSNLGGVERTMANLKSIDMFQVRPPPTAVHMVQLPNPPTANSHVATANGLLSSGSVGVGTNGGSNATGQPSQQQAPPLGQQPQEEPSKGGSSNASGAEDALSYSGGGTGNNVEMNPPMTVHLASDDTHPAAIVTAPSTSSVNDSVTLVSTPAVSIFQVAHRPANHSNPVTLQPVAAVTGFNYPPPVTLPTPVPARAKAPASAGRGRSRGAGRAAQAAAVAASSAGSEASLSQLLAQSPDSTESGSSAQTFNGPANSGRGQGQPAGRVVRAIRRESQTSEGSSSPSVVAVSGSGGVAADSGPCRVPLVKYVDLDMVSSPTRPRPTGSIGMRRQSQGSNSNSPDPHQTGGRSSAGSKRGASVNPASPAVNSPQSPAIQAPPSPLSFRKQQQQSQQSQHYAGSVYRADGKSMEAQKADRLSSPSHPSQCSSPFSRPSSRSQDASPSPSELLGSMYPPSSFLPYSSSDPSGTMVSTTTSGRNNNFGGASPSQSPSALPALPKFQQAFGKKSLTTHFDILPSGMMGSANPLPGMSTLQEGGRVTVVSAAATSSSAMGGNGYASDSRRFASGTPADQQPPNPPAEDEGLGSKLQSLLESALNGQISRSPTRHMQSQVHPQHGASTVIQQPQQQQMVGFSSSEMLLGGSNPLDAQSADNESVSGGNFLLSEQLREFESVFERVASTSHLKDSSLPPMGAWASDLTGHDHGPDPDDLSAGSYSMMTGPVADYLAPASNYSGSMDVSAASPVSVGAASALSATGNNSAACCSPHSTDDPMIKSADSGQTQPESTEAPLMQLLTVASAARQALADEEKCSNSNSSSNSVISSGSSNSSHPAPEEIKQEIKLEPTDEEPNDRPPSQATESTVAATTATSRTTVTSVIVAASDNSKPQTRMVVLPATGSKAPSASSAPAETTPAPNGSNSNTSDSNASSAAGSAAATTPPTSSANTSTTATKSEATPTKSARGSKQTSSKSSPAVSPGAASGGSSPSKSTAPVVSSSSAAASPAVPAAAGAAGAAKPPQKAHDDEMTVLRVNAILDQYREQLRNSPDLQNKPAPRRRSNPLPSPSATTPKRRKSVQSKVKLLSQHAGRPADSAAPEAGTSTTPAAASAEPVAATTGSNSNSSVEPPVESPSKNESSTPTADPSATTTTTAAPVTTTSASVVTITSTPATVTSTASVQMLNTSTISIPVSAVAAAADSSTSGRLIQHSTFIHTTTGEGTTFATTPTISIGTANSSAVPIMQQLLVTSQSGVRQVLLPIANMRQALVARGGVNPGTRFIYARHFVGVPARLATPITVRAVGSTSAVQAQADAPVVTAVTTTAVATSTTGTASASPGPAQEQRVLIQELLAGGQNQRIVNNATGTLQWTTTATLAATSTPAAPEAAPEVETATSTTPPAAVSTTEAAVKVESTGSVLRFVPTVNRVSLPVAPGVDAATLLAAASQSNQTILAPPAPATPTESAPAASTPTESDPISAWTGAGSPPAPAVTSVDDALPPVPLGVATDEKMLNDAETGVSEFLPCADFMGPGVSPSPCFSFSDSPLGSQNSSPATSPATFQASSAEDDSNNGVSLDESGSSGTVPAGGATVGGKRPTSGGQQHNKSKILKRNDKPRVTVVRKDHGSMEYRRVGDGHAVVRPSHRRSFSRKQALAKQAAAAAAAANQKLANLQTPSPTPPTDTEMPVLIKEEPGSPALLSGADQEELTMPQLEPQPFTEDVASGADEPAIKTEGVLLSGSVSSPPMTEEDSSPPLLAPVPVDAADPVVESVPEATTGRQRRQSRRCVRQREEPIVKTESDSSSQDRQSPLKTKRRSSTRGHVKKNCPCCVSGNGSSDGKRIKSEPSAASVDCSVEASDAATETTKTVKTEPVNSTTSGTVASALPAGSKSAKSKKNAQRKR